MAFGIPSKGSSKALSRQFKLAHKEGKKTVKLLEDNEKLDSEVLTGFTKEEVITLLDYDFNTLKHFYEVVTYPSTTENYSMLRDCQVDNLCDVRGKEVYPTKRGKELLTLVGKLIK